MRGTTLTFLSSSFLTTTLVAIILGSLVSGCGGGGGGGGGAVASAAPERFLFLADADVENRHELYAADPRGGMPTKISGELVEGGDVHFPRDEARAPQISPDGTLVAYRADQEIDGRVELFLTSSHFPNSFRISADDVDQVEEFGFSPDGKYLHYVATGRDYGLQHLHVVSVSGDEDSIRTSPHLGPGQQFTDIRWSPDSTDVAYVVGWLEEIAVFVYSVTDDALTEASIDAYGDKRMEDILWSPDGTRLAYEYYDDASEEAQLYVTDPTGMNSIVVADPGAMIGSYYQFSCDWSPDGTQLLVAENGSSSMPALHLISFDGTEVSSEGVDLALVIQLHGWNPDGSGFSYLAYIDDLDRPTMHIVSAEGEELQTISNVESYQYSPGGERFLVTSEFAGSRDLLVYLESGVTHILEGNITSHPAAWSPDGNHVAYMSSSANGNTELRVWDRLSGRSTVIEAVPQGSTISRYEWTTSGSRLLYWSDEDGSGQRAHSCTAAGGSLVSLSDLVGMKVVIGPRD